MYPVAREARDDKQQQQPPPQVASLRLSLAMSTRAAPPRGRSNDARRRNTLAARALPQLALLRGGNQKAYARNPPRTPHELAVCFEPLPPLLARNAFGLAFPQRRQREREKERGARVSSQHTRDGVHAQHANKQGLARASAQGRRRLVQARRLRRTAAATTVTPAATTIISPQGGRCLARRLIRARRLQRASAATTNTPPSGGRRLVRARRLRRASAAATAPPKKEVAPTAAQRLSDVPPLPRKSSARLLFGGQTAGWTPHFFLLGIVLPFCDPRPGAECPTGPGPGSGMAPEL